MSQASNLVLPQECLGRASTHDATGEYLFGRDDEWAAVAFFYASYHRVRASILADPVFDSLVDLPKVDARLRKEHQAVSRHEGRIVRNQGREIGVNDLVRALYRPIYSQYLVLHDASVNVRYGKGITSGRVRDARSSWDTIRQAQLAGELVWHRS